MYCELCGRLDFPEHHLRAAISRPSPRQPSKSSTASWPNGSTRSLRCSYTGFGGIRRRGYSECGKRFIRRNSHQLRAAWASSSSMRRAQRVIYAIREILRMARIRKVPYGEEWRRCKSYLPAFRTWLETVRDLAIIHQPEDRDFLSDLRLPKPSSIFDEGTTCSQSITR